MKSSHALSNRSRLFGLRFVGGIVLLDSSCYLMKKLFVEL